MGPLSQGAASSDPRYQVIPRTLIFITSGAKVLLLKGAPTKRLWPNKYNGIGGHVERGENIYAAAQREIVEETGIRQVDNLFLRGIITVDTGISTPGILLFVFRGSTRQRDVIASDEGMLEWVDWKTIPGDQMLADLPHLLPRVLLEAPQAQLFYGHYSFDAQGQLQPSFDG